MTAKISNRVGRNELRHTTTDPLNPSVGQETSDIYEGVVTKLDDTHRVIVCRDGIQWITQRRKAGGADRLWRGLGYFRTRKALIRACATLCERADPGAMSILLALPDVIGGAL
jgi:hypothetical protein